MRLNNDQRTKVKIAVTRWIMFSVLYSLIPIAFQAWEIIRLGSTPSWSILVSSGSLLLIATGLSAKSLSNIVTSKASDGAKLFVTSVIGILLIVPAYLYGSTTAPIILGQPLANPEFFTEFTTGIFLFICILGAFCARLGAL